MPNGWNNQPQEQERGGSGWLEREEETWHRRRKTKQPSVTCMYVSALSKDMVAVLRANDFTVARDLSGWRVCKRASQ